MALAKKPTASVPAQNGPQIAVLHVSEEHEGGYLPPISTPLTSSDCNKPLNNSGPTPENGPSTVVLPPNQPAETSTDSAIGQAQEAKIEGSERVSLPEFKVRTDLETKNQGAGPALSGEVYTDNIWPSETGMGASSLTPLYPLLITTRHPFKDQVIPAAHAGTFAALLDQVNAALLDAVQLRWGYQRVTTRTLLAAAPYRGAPVQTDSKLVGQTTATTPELIAARDADYFAATVAFLEFLEGSTHLCLREGRMAELQHALERRDIRVQAHANDFTVLAKEAADILAALAKADEIAAAGGWPADKVDAADRKLKILTARLAPIGYVLMRWRPELMPGQEVAA